MAFPVTRSSRNSRPSLLITATAGIVVPPRLTSTSAGARQCTVPDVVVHALEMPQVLARIRVGRDETAAEQIVPFAVAAVLIDRRRAKRHVDDAARGVHGDEAPHIRARPLFPAVTGPGVVV